MEIVKKILTGLGVVFVLFIVLVMFITGASSKFEDRHKGFVESFTRDFSQNWLVEHVAEKMTNEMLEEINTSDGRRAVGIFKTFGKLVDVIDIEIHDYSANANSPNVGTFKFKANFKNAKTLVTLTVHEADGVAKVQYLHIQTVGDVATVSDINV